MSVEVSEEDCGGAQANWGATFSPRRDIFARVTQFLFISCFSIERALLVQQANTGPFLPFLKILPNKNVSHIARP